MAGEGSVLNMIKTLKANRSMIRKRKPLASSKNAKTNPLKDHKQFTKEAKKEYYSRLKVEKLKNRKKMVLAGILTILGLILFFSGLNYWIRMVFDF